MITQLRRTESIVMIDSMSQLIIAITIELR